MNVNIENYDSQQIDRADGLKKIGTIVNKSIEKHNNKTKVIESTKTILCVKQIDLILRF